MPTTWMMVGLVMLVAVVLALSRLASGSGSAPSASPIAALASAATPSPIPTPSGSPVPEPTIDPLRLNPCATAGLAMVAGGWGGATGSMGGGATLINVSNEVCRIGGKPAIQLVAADGAVIATSHSASPGEPIPLPPGGVANVTVVWGNWCGDPPGRPLTLRLALIDGPGTLVAEIRDWEPAIGSVPRCDAPTAPSTIGVPLPFAAAEPESGGALGKHCAAGDLDAFLGGWGAAAGTSYAPVVVLNRSDGACSVSTAPAVELRDAGSKLLVTGEPWLEDGSTLDLAAGTTAITSLGFSNWCIAAPQLPFHFDLRIGGEAVPIVPTSEFSEIGLPSCNSAPATPPPSLFWSDPFALPGS